MNEHYLTAAIWDVWMNLAYAPNPRNRDRKIARNAQIAIQRIIFGRKYIDIAREFGLTKGYVTGIARQTRRGLEFCGVFNRKEN